MKIQAIRFVWTGIWLGMYSDRLAGTISIFLGPFLAILSVKPDPYNAVFGTDILIVGFGSRQKRRIQQQADMLFWIYRNKFVIDKNRSLEDTFNWICFILKEKNNDYGSSDTDGRRMIHCRNSLRLFWSGNESEELAPSKFCGLLLDSIAPMLKRLKKDPHFGLALVEAYHEARFKLERRNSYISKLNAELAADKAML